MSIYPHRSSNGSLTGKYRVEVQLNRRRLKALATKLCPGPKCCGDLECARAVEKRLGALLESGALPAPTAPTQKPTTLLGLLDAASGSLWQGAPEHRENCHRAIRHAAGIITTPLASLATTDLDRLVEYLKAKGLTPATINRHLSALHTLLDWGRKRGYTVTRPAFDWQEEPERTVRLVEPEEHARLVGLLRGYATQARKSGQGWIGIDPEVPALVADFVDIDWATGLRTSELLKRVPEDVYETVDPKTGDRRWWLKVSKTKTKTERATPLSAEHAALLKARLPWTIRKHQVRYWWDKARAEMGLAGNPRFVRHAIRHAVVSRMSDAGVHPFTIMKAVGHKRIETTLRYCQRTDKHVADAFDTLRVHSGNTGAEQNSSPPVEDRAWRTR